MKFIKLTGHTGKAIVNADLIVEVANHSEGSLVVIDCRALGHGNCRSVFHESPDQIFAMLNDDNPFTVEAQYMLALQQIALLADTGSDLHKQTFGELDGTHPPGWRVAEKMREIANDVLGKDGLR